MGLVVELELESSPRGQRSTFFHVVLKVYADLVERSRTYKERQRWADRMEEIVKVMKQKSGVGGNGVALSVITYNTLLVAYSRVT